MILHMILANSKRLHGRRSSHEFRQRPHGASHFCVISLSLSLNSSGSPHSALKPIIKVANVNSATLDVDLKCSPIDFRRSWRALPFSCLRFRQNCDLWRTHSIRNDVSQFHHLCTLLASTKGSFTSPCWFSSAMVFLYVA